MTREKKRLFNLGLAFAAAFVLVLWGWFYMQYLYLPEGVIAHGVRVGSVDVGGMTLAAAMKKLEPGLSKLEKTPLTLKTADKNYVLAPDQDGIGIDRKQLQKRLLQPGRVGKLWTRWSLRYAGHNKFISVKPPVAEDKFKIHMFLDNVNNDIYRQPVEPVIRLAKGGKIKIIPEQLGYNLNYKAAEKTISELFIQEGYRYGSLPVKKASAKLTQSEIEQLGIKEQVSYFTTYFDIENENRVHNIKTAAQALNNILLKPNQIFSFNDTVGPRSTEKNYKEAKVIINNEFVIGAGGGVCQVSSTLFNAALLAGMNIVERLNHSRPVAYLAAGRDATVVYDAVDLKFQNKTDRSILITTEVKNNGLTVRFFGCSNPGEEIQLVTKEELRDSQDITQKLDPQLPLGETKVEEGSPGLRVSLWRQIWRNGALSGEEKIGLSVYRKVDTVVKVGIGKEGAAFGSFDGISLLPEEGF